MSTDPSAATTPWPAGAMPMFPLGSALLPLSVLPLRVFEPRYLTMIRRCLALDGQFGVVLIERGIEVGGGDSRFDVGTLAVVVDVRHGPDGLRLTTIGSERIRITGWLDDEPHPMATVERWPDEDQVTEADLAASGMMGRLRRTLARASELGERAIRSTVELAPEPRVALWQACAHAPIGELDRQKLLSTPGAVARLARLVEMLDDVDLLFSHRLAE